jgi:hypothetical protein
LLGGLTVAMLDQRQYVSDFLHRHIAPGTAVDRITILLGLRCSIPSRARPPGNWDTLALVYALCSSTGIELCVVNVGFILRPSEIGRDANVLIEVPKVRCFGRIDRSVERSPCARRCRGSKRAGLLLGQGSETGADITWRANIPATSPTREGVDH